MHHPRMTHKSWVAGSERSPALTNSKPIDLTPILEGAKAGSRVRAPTVTGDADLQLGRRAPGPSLDRFGNHPALPLGAVQKDRARSGVRRSDPATRGLIWNACRIALALLCMLAANIAFAGPKIDVVVGADAPELERFAAQELA